MISLHALRTVRDLYRTFSRLGYVKSVIQQKPVDDIGSQLPTLPYPVIHLLHDYLSRKGAKVVELGSGSSTEWLRDRAVVQTYDNDPARRLENVASALPASEEELRKRLEEDKPDVLIVQPATAIREEMWRWVIHQVPWCCNAEIIILDDANWFTSGDVVPVKYIGIPMTGFAPGCSFVKCAMVCVHRDIATARHPFTNRSPRGGMFDMSAQF